MTASVPDGNGNGFAKYGLPGLVIAFLLYWLLSTIPQINRLEARFDEFSRAQQEQTRILQEQRDLAREQVLLLRQILRER